MSNDTLREMNEEHHRAAQAGATTHPTYAPERTPERDQYGMFWHPDLPDCGEDESIIPLLLAQGFEGAVVAGEGEFPEEAIEDGHDAYWAAMRAWQPTPPQGDGWVLAAIYDHENGPHALFVRPWPEPADDIERACRVLAVLHDHSGKEALRDGRPELAAVHRDAVQLFGYMLDLHRIYTAKASGSAPDGEHPDDLAVDLFATAMKAKLATARAKGRGGWDGAECNAEILSRMLREHVSKGDPRDVANFCMFLWNRGESIATPPASAQQADIYEASKTWPDDIRAKLSVHDLRRMSGWAPRTHVGDWRIDTSAGRPILVYQNCSVIEAETATYVLGLIQRDAQQPASAKGGSDAP